jgi:truncated hemoglobin YjbI
MKDIEDIVDIKLFVDEFYIKVREDELLGILFSAVIWVPIEVKQKSRIIPAFQLLY